MIISAVMTMKSDTSQRLKERAGGLNDISLTMVDDDLKMLLVVKFSYYSHIFFFVFYVEVTE